MKRKFGFSLVELLVVIATIAVLLAILTSAIVRARQTAYRVTCLNNLKQLGIAVVTYSQSYDYYPISVPPDTNEKWSDFLADKTIAGDKMLGVAVSLWPFHQTASLYNCPILSRMDCDISYCYNYLAGAKLEKSEFAALSPSYIPPPVDDEFKIDCLKPGDVKSPVRFILLYDLPLKPFEMPQGVDLYKDIDPDDNKTDPNGFVDAAGPHWQGDNILFGDGHSKWHKRWSDSSMSRNPR